MCLDWIEEQIFFKLWDVFLFVVAISEESRQRGEGENDIWVDVSDLSSWAGNCFKQRVWFLNTITVKHCAKFRRLHGIGKHGTENFDKKYFEKQISHPNIGKDH